VPDQRPDVVLILTDQERAAPPYESGELLAWRSRVLAGQRWFDEHAVRFDRHYAGSLACVPSRPTILTGQYPDVHGVTQTDGLGKMADDHRMRWLRPGEVPTLGNWFRAAGYDTHYDGKWHVSHADLTRPDGSRLTTNDDDGHVDHSAVQAYLDADPLAPFGFSGWVGPEPHGGDAADSGLVRDPLLADRVVAWLGDRHARRVAGDADARRPFLLVVSFTNPHDIVFFPRWARRSPLQPGLLDPPHVPPAPTADEDLSTKPAAQIAFRESYFSCYGPARAVSRIYRSQAQRYRDTYYRLHAEVDGPIDRVRRAIVDHGTDTVIIRTADHGELLGAHGGLHQKWFNLYDEATRIPMWIARVGGTETTARSVEAPTSHVDIVPTLLGAAGVDAGSIAGQLATSFSEVHPLPGRDLMAVVDGADPDEDRAVYLLTRDNMPEGDSGASGLARRLGRTAKPPGPLTIQVPAHVAANFEGVVVRVPEDEAVGGAGHLWKLVRSFDDPSTWTEPGHRHLAATGPTGDQFRTEPLDDQWELYDLTADPIEAQNRWADPTVSSVRTHLQHRLKEQRAMSVPERNQPWPYAERVPPAGPPAKTPPPPARLVRRLLQKAGLHPDDPRADETPTLDGGRALVVCTNHGVLDIGKPTGVFASEMTAPYYVFLDAGMEVDLASPRGGVIPVDPQSLKAPQRCTHDDRFLADDDLKDKVTHSLAIGDLDMTDYDIVYLAGGWGAAFDFGFSDELASAVSEANALGHAIGGVCHGPLGLRNATGTDGRPLVAGRRISAVTDKQVHELGIDSTPHHPETELRAMGARFESATKRRDALANHWVVDGNLVTGQNQNAAPMVARELVQLVATERKDSRG